MRGVRRVRIAEDTVGSGMMFVRGMREDQVRKGVPQNELIPPFFSFLPPFFFSCAEPRCELAELDDVCVKC
jgi:hypothetical protein